MKLHIVSLGCTKNLVDTEVMLGRLKNMELTDEPSQADVIIVNTCGFIEAAKSESIQTVLDLHSKRKKDSLLVMAGCLSERYKEELQKELVEVDIFTGVGDYARIDELIAQKRSSFSPKVYLIDDEERIITGSNYHAYVKISEGCNQKCSFCAIPLFKGKLQSRSIDSIAKEVENLVTKGFKDLTFVSQDSSSYLQDQKIKDGLIHLIDRIEKIKGVKSARILYLYPSTTSFDLIDRIESSPVFQNYFDIPIQHISDRMLKLMKRGIGTQKTIELLTHMRAVSDSFIRTTIIVGHPGESEEDFQELLEFLEGFDFDRINIFAYSDEEGTKAYTMEEKLPQEVIDERLAIIQELLDCKQTQVLQKDIGTIVTAYLDGVSQESEFLLSARDIRWAPEIDGEILINESKINDLIPGELYHIKLTEVAGDKLLGTIIDRA